MGDPNAVMEYEAFPSVSRLTLRRWSDFGGSKSLYQKIDYAALEHLTLDNGYVAQLLSHQERYHQKQAESL